MMLTLRNVALFFALLFVLLSVPSAFAAGGGGLNLPSAPIDRTDYASLQRGSALYVNYCSGCHSAQYMRYNRLADDLAIPEDLLRNNLMYTESGIASGIISAMPVADAVEWFHQAAPPDLSLSAKLRGTDWLYAYLRGFYRDESRPSGWNNVVFENVAMPHVMQDLQGTQILDGDGDLILQQPGRMSTNEYDQMIVDLVNFMDYIADPSRAERHRAGYVILSFLMLLLMCTYFLYQEYWRDID